MKNQKHKSTPPGLKNGRKLSIANFMAKACHYAQGHIDDVDAWAKSDRENRLQCISYQMACFFAQNTKRGYYGVPWEIMIDKLAEHPMKTEGQWKKIINKIAKDLGGWE
jgi:hypothetical protein